MLPFSPIRSGRLKSSHLILARELGTLLPILPVANDDERKLFNDLLQQLENEWKQTKKKESKSNQ